MIDEIKARIRIRTSDVYRPNRIYVSEEGRRFLLQNHATVARYRINEQFMGLQIVVEKRFSGRDFLVM